MRTADLTSDVEYATFDGDLIVPVEPIHSNWYRLYDRDKDEWEIVNGEGEPRAAKDPWAGSADRGPGIRRGKPGVLVDRYLTDRRGRRLEDTASRQIVPPQQIAGTWDDYLDLYADVVEARADEREREALEKAASAAITEHFADRFDVDPDDISVWSSRYGEQKVSVSFGLTLKVPKSRAKKPPPPVVRAARHLGLEVSP